VLILLHKIYSYSLLNQGLGNSIKSALFKIEFKIYPIIRVFGFMTKISVVVKCTDMKWKEWRKEHKENFTGCTINQGS
jgi:hypothetical protein